MYMIHWVIKFESLGGFTLKIKFPFVVMALEGFPFVFVCVCVCVVHFTSPSFDLTLTQIPSLENI